MEEKRFNYYHFKCHIYFSSGSCPEKLGKKLEKLGFEGFKTKRKDGPYVYSKSGEDETDLILEPLFEDFLSQVQDDLLEGVEEIESNGGEISIIIGLHEYSDLINVALHLSREAIKMLESLHADVDIDRYLYVEEEEED